MAILVVESDNLSFKLGTLQPEAERAILKSCFQMLSELRAYGVQENYPKIKTRPAVLRSINVRNRNGRCTLRITYRSICTGIQHRYLRIS